MSALSFFFFRGDFEFRVQTVVVVLCSVYCVVDPTDSWVQEWVLHVV